MYGDREGPSEIIIPEQRYMSCGGCKYFTYDLVKSGHHPIHAHNCTHESAPPKGGFYGGNLTEGIYNEVHPGSWCPFVNKEEQWKN